MKRKGYTIQSEADLRGANLRGANLRGANLLGADLRGADLRGANLQGAHLLGAHFRGAHLRGADLRGADLREADLREADLLGANFRGADLREADLREADLRYTDLRYTDLQGARIDISMALKAYWTNPSSAFCLELMRLDCELLSNGRALFTQWKKTGKCPFSGNIQRGYYFKERVDLWSYARPKPMWKIWKMACKEYQIKF